MKISVVSHSSEFSDAESINFFSNKYFIDRNLLFVKLSHLKSEITEINSSRETISSENCKKIDYWVSRKKNEVREFYQHSGVVILICDTKPLIYLLKDDHVNYFSIDLVNIFKDDNSLEYNPFEGNNFTAHPLVKDISEVCEIKFHSTFIVRDKNSKTLFSTIKTSNTISFCTKKENGLLVVLPDINPVPFYGQTWEESQAHYLNCLSQLIENIKGDADAILDSAPKWINDFQFSNETTRLKELQKLFEKKTTLEAEILDLQTIIKKYSFIKSILYTKGPALETGVEKCFEHIGAKFFTPEGSNTDMIVEFDNSYFAIEIKGSNSSASKQHVRQLEEWVNSAALKYNKEDCKGILIINTFCDIPINERPQSSFPPNVIEFSSDRNHCLITTLTFLNLISDFDSGKIHQNDILALIKKTKGILKYP